MVLCVSLSILWYVLLSVWVRARAQRPSLPGEVCARACPYFVCPSLPLQPPAYFSFDDNPLVLCK